MDRYSILRGLDPPEESLGYVFTEEDKEVCRNALIAELERKKIPHPTICYNNHLIAGVRRSGKSHFLVQDIQRRHRQQGGPILVCSVNKDLNINLSSMLNRDNSERYDIVWCTPRNFQRNIRGYDYSACYFDEIMSYNINLQDLFYIVQNEIRTEKVVMAADLSSFASHMLTFRENDPFVGPWDLAREERSGSFDGSTFYYRGQPWLLHVFSDIYR